MGAEVSWDNVCGTLVFTLFCLQQADNTNVICSGAQGLWGCLNAIAPPFCILGCWLDLNLPNKMLKLGVFAL